MWACELSSVLRTKLDLAHAQHVEGQDVFFLQQHVGRVVAALSEGRSLEPPRRLPSGGMQRGDEALDRL